VCVCVCVCFFSSLSSITPLLPLNFIHSVFCCTLYKWYSDLTSYVTATIFCVTVMPPIMGSDEEDVIRCICGIYRDEGMMLQCEKCLVSCAFFLGFFIGVKCSESINSL
jgi:hypothetical protein